MSFSYKIILAFLILVMPVSIEASFSKTDSPGVLELKNIEMPTDVTTGKDGWIYVTDSLNAKVLVFDRDGKMLFYFGEKGKGKGKFILPWAVDIDEDKYVYVTDIAEHLVSIFTLRGNVRAQFGGLGTGEGKFNTPFDLVFAKGGRVFILDTGNNQIQIIMGKFVKQFGREGVGNGEFRNPTALVATDKGKLYVVDSGNNRIQIFNTRGDYISKFGKPGEESGEFFQPQGIAIDSKDRIFVSDSGNNRIECFNENGEPLFVFGKKGNKIGEFDDPGKIYIDKEDRLYVVDTKNNRVQILDDVVYRYAPCETCHKRKKDSAVSVHAVYNEGCDKCHLSHGKTPGMNLIKDIKELCLDCHKTDIPGFVSQHQNYPVEKISCADCHDPHMSQAKKLLRGHKPVVQGKCESCHTIKKNEIRFIDEKGMLCYACHTVSVNKKHSGINKESPCAVCHKTHGSSYGFLLTRDLPQICFNDTCHSDLDTTNHAHPFNIYPSSKIRISSDLRTTKSGQVVCTTCHSSHNSEHKSLLRNLKGELCIKCHGGFGEK